jgi:hypothetical protein
LQQEPQQSDTISIVPGSASKTTTASKHGWISQQHELGLLFLLLLLPPPSS